MYIFYIYLLSKFKNSQDRTVKSLYKHNHYFYLTLHRTSILVHLVIRRHGFSKEKSKSNRRGDQIRSDQDKKNIIYKRSKSRGISFRQRINRSIPEGNSTPSIMPAQLYKGILLASTCSFQTYILALYATILFSRFWWVRVG